MSSVASPLTPSLPHHWARTARAWPHRHGWQLAYSAGLCGAPRRRQECLLEQLREGICMLQQGNGAGPCPEKGEPSCCSAGLGLLVERS